ncbi:Phosphoribosyl-ATP pyrophosphatase (EC 3.6.1.31) [Candidatus Phaeomarinobacter ectocarpi]|uniref:Phosphoribosyl-ATP pyrophosphatase n=1 Tax=Candidatus Phaeomarinibacter ectocarpi TaxID=1458461 RepID=X5MD26_9HYPH|nr:phosphoribosyl-ATP diphosphatase [Candidatus Phaeomarinobacter ectocarpi]CDO59797.1 Phosphoribosyl-ATP pyrophosphatase (EC 3.6.1.31) [Candidatus Phaeomarinobacter ectocarpi]
MSNSKQSKANPKAGTEVLDRLAASIAARKGADASESYTAKLLSRGIEKCAQKLGEEAVETVIAAAARNKPEAVKESADVLYHLMVLWAALDIDPSEVYGELASREGTSGIAEKASRKTF